MRVLVSCIGNILTKSLNLREDRISSCGPGKRMRTFVVLLDVIVDFCNELFDTLECPAANGLLGDEIEPDFDLIEP
jgi:hypothetical protein